MAEPIKAVFISYASEDAPTAERICEALRSAGIDVWFDQNQLRGGDAWDHKIREQIHECGLFIPIISEHSQARSEGYFRLEWDLADQRSHMIGRSKAFIVPVCIDRTAERGADVPDSFLKVQWVRLSAGEASASFAARIAGLLRVEAASHLQPTGASQGAVAAPPNSRRRWLVLVLVAVVAAVAFGWQAWRTPGPSAKSDAAETTARAATESAPKVPERSIAVLPFSDMSPARDQEYMSDGIAEEILNLLAQVPNVKVIARTSSFSFKGKTVPIAEIARQLNVSYVLEGSVRKAGDTLRITAQLIRAADSTHLWSSSYDRPLTDIFVVQTEIANAIVQALQIGLMGGKLTRHEGGTENVEAYQLYLRAKQRAFENTRASLDAAEQYARRAVEMDPAFGLGWAELSNVAALRADNGFVSAAEGFERSREYALHALDVSPGLADAKSYLGYILFEHDWNWPAAEAQFKEALALEPMNYTALNMAGRLKASQGRWDEAERYLTTGLARDPLNPYLLWNLGHAYYLARRFEDSERVYRQLLASTPDFGWTRGYLGKTLLALGRAREGLEIAEGDAEPLNRLTFLPILLQAAGRRAEADAALARQVEVLGDVFPIYVAETYAYRGERDRAFDWLERAYAMRDPVLLEIVGEPIFDAMADDPRFKAFLRRMNLPENPPLRAGGD